MKIEQLENELKAIEKIKESVMKERRELVKRSSFLADYHKKLDKIEQDILEEIELKEKEDEDILKRVPLIAFLYYYM